MKRLFYFGALLCCVGLFGACNDSSSSEKKIPERLDGTRWITSQGEGDSRAVVMMEFLDGANARYSVDVQGSGSSEGDVIVPREDVQQLSGDVTYNYRYTYSQPDIVLTPVSMDAPALKGKILGGQGSTYSYM